MSGVGKGVASSSIARILKDGGYRVTAVKIDPYVNVDAGTMNPTEHGEVFVLDDGTECDQDMGNYERFLHTNLSGYNYMTTGSVYLSVIQKERNLEYHGKCVEVVPHVPLAVLDTINGALKHTKSEIVVVEIGGTIGEYQNLIFLEAVRMLKQKHPDDVALVLVSYLPLLNKDNELKTKPTQYAVRTLNSAGLQPDIILARSAQSIDDKRKEKIAFNCNIPKHSVVAAPDVKNIYEIPVNLRKGKIDMLLLKKLGLRKRENASAQWRKFALSLDGVQKTVRIGIVGKYFSSGSFVLADSYRSVIEALRHAAHQEKIKLELDWIDSEQVQKKPSLIGQYDGILVPGGFGARGIEGKIKAIEYARTHKIPYFGLCYGMQLAVVEFTRNVVGLKKAHTTEADPKTPYPVIAVLPEQKEYLALKKYGATMRLGGYPAVLQKNTIAREAYGKPNIRERHRHRYEVNPDYLKVLADAGLVISGISPSQELAEIIELPRTVHPFFVGTQFHPELTSRPLEPHPLFCAFMKAAKRESL